MATDIDGAESISPTQRLAIERARHESPATYLARLAAHYEMGEDWGSMTVLEFCERIAAGRKAK